jgi:hypothetical protein
MKIINQTPRKPTNKQCKSFEHKVNVVLGCNVQNKDHRVYLKGQAEEEKTSKGGRRGGPPAGMEEAESAYSTRQKKPPSPLATHRTETTTRPDTKAREKTQRTPFGCGKVTLKSSATSIEQWIESIERKHDTVRPWKTANERHTYERKRVN